MNFEENAKKYQHIGLIIIFLSILVPQNQTKHLKLKIL